MIERDAKVIVGKRVLRIGGDRFAITRLGFVEAAVLVQRYTTLVPELRAVRLRSQQLLIQLEGGLRVLAKDVHLGHRLQHEVLVFALLQRETVFAQCFHEVALLPEGEAQIVSSQPSFSSNLHLAPATLLARSDGLFIALWPPLLEGQVRLRARQRRIELDR